MKQHAVASPQKRDQLVLLGTLFGLSLADAVLTRFIVSDHLGGEGNPWLKGFASGDGLIAIKALGTLLAALLLWDIYRRHPRLVHGITIAAVCFYTVIVYWNVLTVFLGSAGRAIFHT